MAHQPGNHGRGRGRGRGGNAERGNNENRNGRGGGRGGGRDRGHGRGDSHGDGRGSEGTRGGHGGRGGRGGLSTEDKSQIMIARREETLQVAMTEGTDDVICAADAPNEGFQGFAIRVLDHKDFEFQDFWGVRRFINSCLVNLSNHHTIDVSRLIPALATPGGIARLTGLMLMRMITDGGGGSHTNSGRLSFQYDVLPLVSVLTREKVCLTTLTTESNAIYNAVYNYRKWFLEDGILPCMTKLIARGSIEDTTISAERMSKENPYVCTVKSFQRALLVIVRLVFQLVKRIGDARLELASVVKGLCQQAKDSRLLVEHDPTERYLSDIVLKELGRLQRMTSDVEETDVASLQIKEKTRSTFRKTYFFDYDPPGDLSTSGARHGNDKVQIRDINILPKFDEIACQRNPFLPANGILEAPHFLDPGWRRQLDTHFRLYREDFIDPLRKGIIGFMDMLDKTPPNQEINLLKPKELRKRLPRGLLLKIYKVDRILRVEVNRNEGISLVVSFEQPAQTKDMDPKARKTFWEKSKQRLMSGGLVSLVRRSDRPVRQRTGEVSIQDKFDMHLAVVTDKDIGLLSENQHLANIRLTSSNPEFFSLLFQPRTKKNPWFLVESSGGFFEAFKPILMALQRAVPATLPFGRYLAPTKEEIEMNARDPSNISPPTYATVPGFQFDLSVILNKGVKAKLDVQSPGSIRTATTLLQNHSTLDYTQAQALVETLCREVALISGPPGTGKTKIGVDLMRVLLHNKEKMKCGPILCICYTNHALDQFLEHLLDIGETNIVRIGARSKSEKLEPYTLHNRKQLNQFNIRKAVAMAMEKIETVQEKIQRIGKAIETGELSWRHYEDFLTVYHPAIYDRLLKGPPIPIKREPPGRVLRDPEVFYHWKNCVDIKDREEANKDIGDPTTTNQYEALISDVTKPKYKIPKKNRPLEHLHNDIWEMSGREREKLMNSWKPIIFENMKTKLGRYIKMVNEAIAEKRAAYDDSSRHVLKSCSVIGMTTNGAAKMNELISSISPKIILCEEAGEVLESHILSALSPSTQHLILIGDHLQLRPQIETYELSMDSKIGKVYKLDQSLFERLVTAEENPLPMSKLTIQRRMRPEISNLIRTTLYPHLEDGPDVSKYPPVTGMFHNLFFMDHDHPEDGKEQDGSSFSNAFEVQMIEALALYLIKNGYDQEGDIAILTPYLGQLSKLRDGLSKSFTLMIDERDQDQLDKKEDQDSLPDDSPAGGVANARAHVKKVSLNRQLTLRTIDNYQGEEAKIIIISLVRNRSDSLSNSIGFLKSPNRTNVLLSRAKHGMFILGNARLMESKKEFGIWPEVINELREKGHLGDGFRLRCKNHPMTINAVNQPSVLYQCAPNGGCIQSCGYNMACGHVCPLQCHPDDPEHRIVRCFEPCMRLHPVCLHPCEKECGQDCGDCKVIVEPILLGCFHLLEKPQCWQKKNPSRVVCKSRVPKKLPTCEHIREMECSQDPKNVKCTVPCGVILEGCNHKCIRTCKSCQSKTRSSNPELKAGEVITRTNHESCLVKCDKNLLCGHSCEYTCHHGSTCPPCKKACAVACEHFSCKNTCDTVCAPCCAKCTWDCPHQGRCDMPCGAPCDRLPCNKRCEKQLQCGHQCPSVCGEPCAPQPYCQECKDPSKMELVVDLIMQDTLANVDLNDDPILVLSCGHALTISTLDGMMEMNTFYKEHVDSKTGSSTFVSKLPLPGAHPSQIGCPHCRRPIMSPLRYGRRIKYAQLAMRLKKYQMKQSTHVLNAQKMLEEVQVSLMANKANFLASLERAVAEDQLEPPPERSRKFGRLVHDTDNLPELNLFAGFSSYGIPQKQGEVWKGVTSKVRKLKSKFDDIYKETMESPSRKLFEVAVSYLYRAKVMKAEIQKIESESLLLESEHAEPTTPADSSSADPSSSTATTELKSMQSIEPETIPGVVASGIIQECIRECGLPVDGYGGTSHLDVLQGLIDMLLIVSGLVFEIMNGGREKTGWYWYQEDILKGAMMVATKFIEVAQNGKFGRRELIGQVHVLELIVMQARWRTLRIGVSDNREQRIQDVAALETQYRNMLRKFVTLYPNVETPTDESKQVKRQCLNRTRSLETDIQGYVEASKSDTFYTSVSDQERLQIFQAVREHISGSGHWYECPNGHTYVIGECGMAMEQSRCPECGATVGGGDHRLLGNNSLSTRFEDLYRQTP